MSDFQELIKSFPKTREYVRDFFVYGFKTRQEFTEKSPRTYDNERRRLESWLAPYVQTASFLTPTLYSGYGKQKALQTTILPCIS